MRVLIGCEESGVVRDSFAEQGHDAWSCDMRPTQQPGNHFQRDILEVIGMGWDLMIAHPECRYLSNSGVHLLNGKKQPAEKKAKRWDDMVKAAEFFRELLNAPIKKVCIENPVIHGFAKEIIGRGQDQTIQPYDFGEDASKRTCLWLKGLPKLINTEYFPPKYGCKCGQRFQLELGKYGCPNCNGDSGAARQIWGNQTPSGQNKIGPSANRSRIRAKTYKGIAKAFADQWGR